MTSLDKYLFSYNKYQLREKQKLKGIAHIPKRGTYIFDGSLNFNTVAYHAFGTKWI